VPLADQNWEKFMKLRPRNTALRAGLLSLLVLMLGSFAAGQSEKGLEVQARLIARSESPKPRDIAPYREALVVYEYEAADNDRGLLRGRRFRVAHWGLVNLHVQPVLQREIGSTVRLKLLPLAKAQKAQLVYRSDTLPVDYDVAYYFDAGQTVVQPKLKKGAFAYNSNLSRIMPSFARLRGQLRIVTLGDSASFHGISPRHLVPGDPQVPRAMNLAVAASGLELQSILATEYLDRAPNLKWVIWGLAPRQFIKSKAVSDQLDGTTERFKTSYGRKLDLEYWDRLWTAAPPKGLATIVDLHEAGVWEWPYGHLAEEGWRPNKGQTVKETLARQRRSLRWTAPDDAVDMQGSGREHLEKAIRHLRARGVKVLLFAIPFHPITRETAAVDEFGTSHKSRDRMAAELARMAENTDGVHFFDAYKWGLDALKHEHYYDHDHLCGAGAERLSKHIAQLIAKIDPVEASGISSPSKPEDSSDPTAKLGAAEFRSCLRSVYDRAKKNGQAVVEGDDGWYFLTSELRSYSRGPFAGAAAKSASVARKDQDPLPAILHFKSLLERKGIELIMMPVPGKVCVYPDKLDPALLPSGRPDAEHAAFYERLQEAGIEVIDLLPDFLALRKAGKAPYCRQDSHWSPAGVRVAADRLVKSLEQRKWFADVRGKPGTIHPKEIKVRGDLVEMLNPTGAEDEVLTVEEVRIADGHFQSSREAPLLMIGDSHLIVYQTELLAEHAGLADLVAGSTGCAIDLVGVRGGGSNSPRVVLARRRDNLKGKRCLVWCFTAREFTESRSGWKKIPVIR
jgi:predicted Zn-ribbon and HTH transcriptional regulator